MLWSVTHNVKCHQVREDKTDPCLGSSLVFERTVARTVLGTGTERIVGCTHLMFRAHENRVKAGTSWGGWGAGVRLEQCSFTKS